LNLSVSRDFKASRTYLFLVVLPRQICLIQAEKAL
jgi:hypothetical protein